MCELVCSLPPMIANEKDTLKTSSQIKIGNLSVFLIIVAIKLETFSLL